MAKFDLFHDFENQLSWGRICALVCLVVAVYREFTGADLQHVSLWLGVATGNYGTSKLTQMVSFIKSKVTTSNTNTNVNVTEDTSASTTPSQNV